MIVQRCRFQLNHIKAGDCQQQFGEVELMQSSSQLCEAYVLANKNGIERAAVHQSMLHKHGKVSRNLNQTKNGARDIMCVTVFDFTVVGYGSVSTAIRGMLYP